MGLWVTSAVSCCAGPAGLGRALSGPAPHQGAQPRGQGSFQECPRATAPGSPPSPWCRAPLSQRPFQRESDINVPPQPSAENEIPKPVRSGRRGRTAGRNLVRRPGAEAASPCSARLPGAAEVLPEAWGAGCGRAGLALGSRRPQPRALCASVERWCHLPRAAGRRCPPAGRAGDGHRSLGEGRGSWALREAARPPAAARRPRCPPPAAPAPQWRPASSRRAGTFTFPQELRVDDQDEEAAERGRGECPERLRQLHRGVPARPAPPKSRSEGPGAASAPRRVQPPRPPARALHPPPAPRLEAPLRAAIASFWAGGGERGGARGGGGRGRGG